MKLLAILITLIFSSQAFAFPPVGAVGQGQTSNLYPTVNKAPNSQITNIGSGAALIETGNNNLLGNPSFEHSTFNTGWTQTAGTSAVETSIVVQGQKAYKAVLSAATLELYQDSTRYAAQFADGVQGIASIRVKTSVAGIFVCPRQAGATVLTGCATVDSSNKWLLYKVPYVFGATSNGLAIVSGTMTDGLVTVGNVTGDVFLDDGYVGTDAGIADVSVITPWVAYTPTYTNFGTVTSSAAYWRQVGSDIEVEATFTSGTPAAAIASMSLPGSYTIDSSKVSRANTTANPGSMIGHWSNVGANNNGRVVTATGTSTSFVYFGINFTSAANQTPQNGSTVLSASAATAVRFSVPIANLSGSTQVFASQCGASCADRYVAKIAGTTSVVSDENVDWINGNASGTNPYTITFNSGIFTTAPVCVATSQASTTSNPAISFGSGQPTSTGITILVKVANTAAATTGNIELVCYKTLADYQASRTIVGSFKEVPKVPGINSPKTCLASWGGSGATLSAPNVCTTGTCVEMFDSCGTFSPPAFLATGVYTEATFAAGTFANSSYIHCSCTAWDSATNQEQDCIPFWQTGDNTVITSAAGLYKVDIETPTGAGVQRNTYAQLKCEGQMP